MEPRTEYVRDRIEALALLGYYSNVAEKYVHYLLKMEHLLSSYDPDLDPSSRKLEEQYPVDWVLIRRELEEIEAAKNADSDYQSSSSSERNPLATAERVDPSLEAEREKSVSTPNEAADDGRIQISVSLEYGQRKGWFSTWEWEHASFSDIEGTAVHAAMMAVQYYMRAVGYEAAPKAFTMAVHSHPVLSGTTIYERRWVL